MGGDSVPILLEVDNVSKSYGQTRALSGVSLSVRQGEVHALLGGNGSGKSTLIKALAGVIAFDHGGRLIASQRGVNLSAERWSPHHAREAYLRFVHQDLGLFPELSIIDNLALGSGYVRTRWGRVRWAAGRAYARQQLERYGIEANPRHKVAGLNLAQGAMLAIARALQDIGEDDKAVVVLDESTGALPPAESDALHGSIQRLTARGHAVLLVTHDLDEALTRCDRVTVLRDGHRIHTGPTSELDRRTLIELIVGSPAEDAQRRQSRQVADAAPLLLAKTLADGQVLNISDLMVCQGEIVGVAGLLGSGVDLLLPAIFGLRHLERCDMAIEGNPYMPRAPRSAMSQGVAYLPSDRLRDGTFRSMSVLENLSAASIARSAPRGRIRHRSELRETQGLITNYRVKPADPRRRIESLSGGNQQKVLLARWARRGPRLLLLDDPTRGVDVGARADIWSLLRSMTETSRLAILVTSSDPAELAAECDRVLVLGNGRVVTELAGDDLEAAHITAAAYDGSIEAIPS